MTLSGTSFWTLVRRRVKSWKLIRSRDEILKNFGKWRKTARFYVSVKIVLQHSNKALKLHANLEVIKIFQVMNNFELFHQNVIKKIAQNSLNFTVISFMSILAYQNFEIPRKFTSKLSGFLERKVLSRTDTIFGPKILIFRVRNWSIFGTDPYSERLITYNRWFCNSEG